MTEESQARKVHKADVIPCCPNCGSGDTKFCGISVRPYCNECKYWGAVNFGSKEEAIARWKALGEKQ
jgi:hypothetical protein